MKLFSGLLAEGLEASYHAFMQLTKDEQQQALITSVNTLRQTIDNVQLRMSSVRDAALKERFQDITNELTSTMEEIAEEAKIAPIDAFFKLMFFPFYTCFELSTVVWGEFFNMLQGWFEPVGPVSYEQAVRNAERFLTLAGDFNIIATIFDLIGHVQILGTRLPANAVAFFIRNISWTFGIGWLTWVVMSPVLRYSIADPYDAEMRKRTRPTEFTRAMWEELWEKGIATIDEVKDGLVELGYKDELIEKWLNVIRLRLIESEARAFIKEVEDAYAEGRVKQHELFDYYDSLRLRGEEKHLRFYKAWWRLQNKINDLRVKEIERAFKQEKIDEAEATARLSEFIVDAALIEQYIALWKQYIKPEEVIEADEKAKYRIRRLEVRIEGLEKQIMHLETIRKEKVELYQAMIDELAARLDAKIAAAREEFAAFVDKKVDEIEARISYLQKLLEEVTDIEAVRIAAKIELLVDIAEVVIAEREAKLLARIERWKEEVEARIKTIEQRRDVDLERLQLRIDKLKSRLDD